MTGNCSGTSLPETEIGCRDQMQGSEIQTSGKSGKSMSEMTKFAAFFLILYKSCHLPVLSACVLKKIPV